MEGHLKPVWCFTAAVEESTGIVDQNVEVRGLSFECPRQFADLVKIGEIGQQVLNSVVPRLSLDPRNGLVGFVLVSAGDDHFCSLRSECRRSSLANA